MLIEMVAAGALSMTAPPIEKATLDDCLMAVAIAKDQFGWGKTPIPAGAAVPGIELKSCPWSSLGVTPPTDAKGRRGFSLQLPVYDATGTHAEVRVDAGHAENGLWMGEVMVCSLTKVAGRWRVDECNVMVVT